MELEYVECPDCDLELEGWETKVCPRCEHLTDQIVLMKQKSRACGGCGMVGNCKCEPEYGEER